MKIHNFSAGPCILPQEVIQQCADAVLNFNNSGLSLIEISHRDKSFVTVMEESMALVKKLLKLDDDFEVLFLQGGASLQFIMVPYNLLKENGKAAYTNTGVWAAGAIKEAKKFGEVIEVASSKEANYTFIPKNYEIPKDVDYFHCTSNNTIYGTQMKSFPEFSGIKVCDMSSDIMSKVIDFNQFDLIYAGAQKNMGPAGSTMVAVRKSILGKSGRNIPSYLDYKIHIDKESMLNTPGVFSVYGCMLTLRWLDKIGGIEAIEKVNNAKAELLYNEIDRNPLFKGVAEKEDRSVMNATFVLTDVTLEEKFNEMWKSAGISGIKGHRSVGGYRASMYNALPLESVQALVDVMQALETSA